MNLFTEETILSPSTAHRLPHSKGLKLTNWLLAKHKINAYAFFIDDDLLKAGFHNDRARAFADLWRQLPHAQAPRADRFCKLAEVLGVPADYSIGRDTKKRGNGPVGKARLLFEKVSQLPRTQQQRILATVEDMLIAQNAKNAL
jgi:hypothetical protein